MSSETALGKKKGAHPGGRRDLASLPGQTELVEKSKQACAGGNEMIGRDRGWDETKIRDIGVTGRTQGGNNVGI